MPGNLYGVSQPGFTPVSVAQSAGTYNANTDTVCFTSASILAPSAGNWFIMGWGVVNVTLGATPPSALKVRTRIQGSSFFFTQNVFASALVANANLMIPMAFAGIPAGTNFFPSGSIIEMAINPTNQAITGDINGGMLMTLFHGPDA